MKLIRFFFFDDGYNLRMVVYSSAFKIIVTKQSINYTRMQSKLCLVQKVNES